VRVPVYRERLAVLILNPRKETTMSNPKRSNVPSNEIRELPLEALDNVMGGSAAPMGLGGSIMPSPLHSPASSLTSHATTGVGYPDHFNLHLGGHGPIASTGAAAAAAGLTGVAGAAQAGMGSTGAAPLGLGGSTGGAIAGHPSVNATSAFQLLEQAAPQDAQAQDAQAQSEAASGAAMPEGLGGDAQ
jgi:hypothetical protein